MSLARKGQWLILEDDQPLAERESYRAAHHYVVELLDASDEKQMPGDDDGIA